MRIRGIAVGLLLAAALPGCQEEPDARLLVLAAASLNQAMPELIERFEESSGVDVDLVLGATGNLAAQIENGAPADLFFSADEATVQRLVDRGAIRGEAVTIYAEGRLVLIWRDGVMPPESLRDLADPIYEAIAIANPELAPYGAAAEEAIRRVGIRNTIDDRLVYGENVSQAYQLVRTGNADAGVVAASVLTDEPPEDRMSIDPALHQPVRQAAGVLDRTRHPAAAAFLDFVLSEIGRTILAEHGFAPPPAAAAAR